MTHIVTKMIQYVTRLRKGADKVSPPLQICDLSPHRVHRPLARSGDREELCVTETEGGDMLDEVDITGIVVTDEIWSEPEGTLDIGIGGRWRHLCTRFVRRGIVRRRARVEGQ